MAEPRSSAPCRGFPILAVSPRLAPWAILFRSYELRSKRSPISFLSGAHYNRIMSPAELYDRDFHEWTIRNAELLRSGRAADADLDHIAEEIEDMGKRERRELLSRLGVLIAHLLKWQAQPERRGRSLSATIRLQREEIGDLISQMPSLKRYLVENLPKAYHYGVVGPWRIPACRKKLSKAPALSIWTDYSISASCRRGHAINSARIRAAASLPRSPISPIGPAHEGQPASHAHPASSSAVCFSSCGARR